MRITSPALFLFENKPPGLFSSLRINLPALFLFENNFAGLSSLRINLPGIKNEAGFPGDPGSGFLSADGLMVAVPVYHLSYAGNLFSCPHLIFYFSDE